MSNFINKIGDLPSIDDVIKTSQGLALLDAVFSPEWEGRYFSFNCMWNSGGGEMMASMRNGSGSEYYIVFSKDGAAGRVVDAELMGNVSLNGIDAPEFLASLDKEPAFRENSASFYFWRRAGEGNWNAFPSDLDNYANLAFLTGGWRHYCKWAEAYYERSIDEKTLREVFCSRKINKSQLTILNPSLTVEALAGDLAEIFGTSK